MTNSFVAKKINCIWDYFYLIKDHEEQQVYTYTFKEILRFLWFALTIITNECACKIASGAMWISVWHYIHNVPWIFVQNKISLFM